MQSSEKAESSQRISDMLKRELGDTILAALEDPGVIEILLNPDGRIWKEVMGIGLVDTGEIMPRHNAENLLCTLASYAGVEINAETPLLEMELPIDGSRFEGLFPPIVSAPAFAIRKRPCMIYTLQDYQEQGILPAHYAEHIRCAIARKENIIIIGGTGSGKTTFANSLLHEMYLMDPMRRLVLIEDTIELQCSMPNSIAMKTSLVMDMVACLKAAMRFRPDSIIIGEVRGAEALALIKAWNTGHPGGIATLHANSAKAGMIRLEQLVQEAGVIAIPAVIAEAVNMIVFITKIKESPGRKVSEVLRVTGHSQHEYVFETL
jgi:type IV secretion system protein TrbB